MAATAISAAATTTRAREIDPSGEAKKKILHKLTIENPQKIC